MFLAIPFLLLRRTESIRVILRDGDHEEARIIDTRFQGYSRFEGLF